MTTGLNSRLPLDDIAAGARLLRGLPGFLRHPIGPVEARAILRRRLERREVDFLELVRRAIYTHPASPYRQLLRLAGCEAGDFERLVHREGVEGALRDLFRRGVYLTVDEFQGRRPVVRGSATLAVDPASLLNPLSSPQMLAPSSGSRGARSPAPIDLLHIGAQAVNVCLALDARGGCGWRHAVWLVPGSSAITHLLRYSALGAPAARWFSQVDPAAPGLHPRYRWSTRLVHWGSVLAGTPLPRARYVPLEDPLPIAHWMAEVLRAGQTPHLHGFVSSAVRLCRVALEAGIDLGGAQFTVVGEPFTEARLTAIQRAGAQVVPFYGSNESSSIASGCLAPDSADDMHQLQDCIAVVQPGAGGAERGLPASSLLISCLRPTTTRILLNASLGDQAEVVQRACGCPQERLGRPTHLRNIRSFEKLTAGGMTFLDVDAIRALEEALPGRFGGGPTDYQLLEQEAEAGGPELRLLVHPALGPLDEGAVADVFLAAIGGGSGVERVMALQWRQAGLPRVERRPPLATASGKILHLQQEGRALGRRTSRLPSDGTVGS